MASSAALSAVMALFRNQLQQTRIRFMSGHVVVCGLGYLPIALAGAPVVAVLLVASGSLFVPAVHAQGVAPAPAAAYP